MLNLSCCFVIRDNELEEFRLKDDHRPLQKVYILKLCSRSRIFYFLLGNI